MNKDKTNIEEILRDLHKNNVVNQYVVVEENGKKYSAFAYIELKIKDRVQAECEKYLDEFLRGDFYVETTDGVRHEDMKIGTLEFFTDGTILANGEYPVGKFFKKEQREHE